MRHARVSPPGAGSQPRPFEAKSPAWLFLQNALVYGSVARGREGSLLYHETSDAVFANERGRALIPYRDPRGFDLLFTYRDGTVGSRMRVLNGTNRVATLPHASGDLGVGFPTWTQLDERILLARQGAPLRVLYLDDGAEPRFENVIARDRDPRPLEVDFDDDGPYLGLVPRGHLVTSYQSRVWLSDGDDVLRWSNGLGDFEGWPASNRRDISDGQAEGITALSSLGDYLVAYRRRSVVVGQGEPANGGGAFSTRKVRTNGIGCIAPRSVVEVNGRHFFLAQTGEICAFDGARIERITHPMQDYLRPQTLLSLDLHGAPRVEAASLPDACAVWYQPWNAYVLMMEGDTAGIHDLGIAVNVDTGDVSFLNGFDAQAMCVKAGDEDSLLTYDRFGVIYIQDRGWADTRTIEPSSSPFDHTYEENRIDVRAVTEPVGLAQHQQHETVRVRMNVEHRMALGPAVRPFADTIGKHGTYRTELASPSLMADAHSTGTPARGQVAVGYLADATTRPEDFIIGTNPVEPDGFLPTRVDVANMRARSVAMMIGNYARADDETDADIPTSIAGQPGPETVSIGAVEFEGADGGPD